MTPEIGQLCLVLALCIAAIQSVLPVAGAQTGNTAWIGVARPAAITQLLFVALAFVCLSWAFVENDFSVLFTYIYFVDAEGQGLQFDPGDSKQMFK